MEQSNDVMVTQVSENYEVSQNGEGKFVRKAVYKPFSSVKPETKEQKIKLLNLLNSSDEAIPLSDHTGEKFQVVDVIMNPYDAIDEETGEIQYGVLCYLFTPKGPVYVTSSKSVYFTLKRLFQVFGEPHYNEEEAVTVEAVRKQGKEFKYIDLNIIG